MKFSTPLSWAKPVCLILALGVAGCQSNAGLTNTTTAKPAAFAPVERSNKTKSSERRSEWQARIKKSREKYLARIEAAREKRKTRIAALRADTSANKNGSERKPISARTGRWDEAGLTIWDLYKRRDNKPHRSTKRVEGPKTAAAPSVTPKGKYGALIAKYAKQHGVPYNLARAVVQVESSFRANVTGAAGEIGLMQIKLATARGMGYKGTRKQLYNPATNLYWGMKYLGRAYQLAGGSTCGTILKYNAGHGAKRMNRISSRYCGRVKRILA